MAVASNIVRANIEKGANPANLIWWGHEFFPGLMRADNPEFHHEVAKMMYDTWKFIFYTFPRGWSKTTLNQIYIAHRIVYNHLTDNQGQTVYWDRYITYKSETETKAESVVRTILDSFEFDEKFIEHYNDGDGNSLKDDQQWTGKQAQFLNGVSIESFGGGQSIRGAKRGGWRVTTAIEDDIDSLEDASSITVMDKHWDKVNRDDIEALDPDFGKMRFSGTVINKDCCTQRIIDDSLMEDSIWKGKVYEALDKNGQSNWPSRFPTAEIVRKRNRAIKRNKYAGWLAENMNKCIDEELRDFKDSYYQYFEGYVRKPNETCLELVLEKRFRLENYTEIVVPPNNRDKPYPEILPIFSYLGVDPAGEDSKGADPDFWVLFVLGLDPYGNIYDFEYIQARMTSVDFIEHLFRLHGLYHFRRVRYESNAGFGNLKSVVEKEMRTRNTHMTIEWKKNTEDKKQRITTILEPPWRSMSIYHRRNMTRLEEEASHHPQIHHEHVLDAKANAVATARYKPRMVQTNEIEVVEKPNWRVRVLNKERARTPSDLLLTQG
jgi:hypothetical protein